MGCMDLKMAEKLERNRDEGRLCLSFTNAGHGCTQRARVRLVEELWAHRVGEGQSVRSAIPFCRRHANMYPPGFKGTNFIVIAHEEF